MFKIAFRPCLRVRLQWITQRLVFYWIWVNITIQWDYEIHSHKLTLQLHHFETAKKFRYLVFSKVVREFSLWFLSFSWKNEKSVKSRGRFLIEFIHEKFQYAFFWVQWYLKLWIWSKNPTFRRVAMAPPNGPKWKPIPHCVGVAQGVTWR